MAEPLGPWDGVGVGPDRLRSVFTGPAAPAGADPAEERGAMSARPQVTWVDGLRRQQLGRHRRRHRARALRADRRGSTSSRTRTSGWPRSSPDPISSPTSSPSARPSARATTSSSTTCTPPPTAGCSWSPARASPTSSRSTSPPARSTGGSRSRLPLRPHGGLARRAPGRGRPRPPTPCTCSHRTASRSARSRPATSRTRTSSPTAARVPPCRIGEVYTPARPSRGRRTKGDRVIRRRREDVQGAWPDRHAPGLDAFGRRLSDAVRPLALSPDEPQLYFQVSFFNGFLEYDLAAPTGSPG